MPTPPSPPATYKDCTAPLADRIADLLGQMTLAEKIGQLQQCPALVYEGRHEDMAADVRQGRWGSRILAGGAWSGEAAEPIVVEELNELQRIAIEESRLGIPLIYARDVIHGHRTVFPIPLAQAASFAPDLIEQGSACVAAEARAESVHWAFAPMIDLCRDPRWGRIIEGYGEDPFLIGHCGAAVIRGYQGTDAAAPDRLLACAKHFCGYGGSEGGRDYDTAEWSDNTLRNMVLPPFQAAIKADVASMMSSFNDLGGTPVSGSSRLMQSWLRKEQNFAGCVVSDWGAITDLTEHGVAEDDRAACALGINAGIDMEMIADVYGAHLADLLKDGRVSIERINEAVRRVLAMKFRAGLFDRPYTDPDRAARVLRHPVHIASACAMAEATHVLLRNRGGLLPLDPKQKGTTLALIGPYAAATTQHLGAWVLDGRGSEVTSIHEGIKAMAPAFRLLTCDGAFSDEMLFMAGRADYVVLCVGESQWRTGEAHNIANYALPPGQDEMIAAVAALGKPLIVVQCSGRPVSSPALERHADAWLLAWHGGTESGQAIARTLLGVTSPAGRLPMSMPRVGGQIPCYYNHKRMGKVRQMAYYQIQQDVRNGPLFPFGYGLTYTKFDYREVRVSATEISLPATIRASVTVTNIGPVASDEVVQCYLHDPCAETSRPIRELKGFQRLHLTPGEARLVTFELGYDELGYYGIDGSYRVDPGFFHLGIGPSSDIPLTTTFRVLPS